MGQRVPGRETGKINDGHYCGADMGTRQQNVKGFVCKFCLGAAIALTSLNASAVDYYNSVVTGVGVVAGEDRIRFTIDNDPKIVLTTDAFSGEQLKRIVALVMASYTSQTPIYFVRTDESTSSTTRHYVRLIFFSAGSRTWD